MFGHVNESEPMPRRRATFQKPKIRIWVEVILSFPRGDLQGGKHFKGFPDTENCLVVPMMNMPARNLEVRAKYRYKSSHEEWTLRFAMGGSNMSNHTWNLADLISAARIVPIGDSRIPAVAISSLTDDSRKVRPGSCFVAIAGARQDGAAFLEQARSKGAVAVIGGVGVSVPSGFPLVQVADPRKSLSRLAAAFHRLSDSSAIRPLKLIGVTGTNGKTTVTWLLRSILRRAGYRPALLGTVEYDLISEVRSAPLTTPCAVELCECLAAAGDAGADHAVFEVSSHALDQGRCDGLRFAAGVYTNLTGDHLDYHITMDAYAAAKKRLFAMLPPDAVAVINADDPRAAEFATASTAPVVSYGIQSDRVDVRGELQLVDRSGTSFVLHHGESRVPIRLPLLGTHNVANALAAAAAALSLGVSLEAIRDGLETGSGVPGRLQRVEPASWPFSVLVDYAHTDDALRNVLTALRPLTPGRVICVFGCGGDRDRGKRPRMAACVSELADLAFVTSDNPRTENPAAIIDEILAGVPRKTTCRIETQIDRRSAIMDAIAAARPGDTVLIAGKGHEDYQLVGDQVLHFDDAQEAREALRRYELETPITLKEEVA